MKYFSMFSGVEGFGQGIERAYEDYKKTRGRGQEKDLSIGRNGNIGGESDFGQHPTCVGFSEIDKFASQVLKYHYPNIKNYGDCKKINWSEVPDFDLLTGGSPCQDFSIAGKRAGIVGERSGLVWEYIRCLKEKKPRYFIFENVKGLLSSRRGFDFGNILVAFSEAGYSLWWQILNAKDFGVPQNRERIFVCGFREESPPEVFFEPRADGKDIQNDTPRNSQHYRVYNERGVAPTLQSQSGWSSQKHPFIQAILTPDRLKKRQNGRRMKNNGEPMFTLNAQDRHGIYFNEEDK